MKKLLIMMNDLKLGGIEKAVINLLKQIPYDQWEITLLLVRKAGEFLDEVPEYVTIIEAAIPEDIRDEVLLATPAIFRKCLHKGKFIRAAKMAFHALQHRHQGMNEIMQSYFTMYDRRIAVLQEKYDIAIDYQGQGSFPTYFVAHKVNAYKKISWIHGDFSVVNQEVDWIELLYESYDKVISVSKKAKDIFVKRFPYQAKKADVCYNVLPVSAIKEKAKAFNVSKDRSISIVTVGRLSYEKGYDVAIRALQKLKERTDSFQYIAVGEGNQRSYLEELTKELGLSENIQFVGFQSNPYPFIAMCDIYLQPSRHEGFCITLGEAKVLGKPIVTTDFAGADEQIVNEEHGLIVKCDEEQISAALIRMLEEPGLLERFQDNLANMSVQDEGVQKFCELIYEG